MKYLKIYELFRQWMPDDLMSKISLVFSILKTEHDWSFRSLKDDIYNRSWVCIINERPIGIRVSEHFYNLRYTNYLEVNFLDRDIPKEYYSDINNLISVKSLLKEYSKKMNCIAISIDDIDSEDIADDINVILLTIQSYLDDL